LQFTKEERLTVAWYEFIEKFECLFISSGDKVEKEAELLSLEQGDMLVVAYESKFVSLSQFTGNMFLTEKQKAQMFERGLQPQIRRFLVSQRFQTLREVADAANK
jgi:hypothetical protein